MTSLWTWTCRNCGRSATTARASRAWAERAARRHHCAPRGADVVPVQVPRPGASS